MFFNCKTHNKQMVQDIERIIMLKKNKNQVSFFTFQNYPKKNQFTSLLDDFKLKSQILTSTSSVTRIWDFYYKVVEVLETTIYIYNIIVN